MKVTTFRLLTVISLVVFFVVLACVRTLFYYPSTYATIFANKITNQAKDEVDTNEIRAHWLCGAVTGYRLAHHNHLPNADRWEEDIQPYWSKGVPYCVTMKTAPGEKPHRLAMNKQFSRMNLDHADHQDQMVLFYETASSKKDTNGDPASMPIRDPQDNRLMVLCYADSRTNLE